MISFQFPLFLILYILIYFRLYKSKPFNCSNQELMSESGQLKESHNEKDKELLSLRDIHETHQRESSTQLRDLEAQLKSSEQRVSDLNESLKIAEEENKSMSTKI